MKAVRELGPLVQRAHHLPLLDAQHGRRHDGGRRAHAHRLPRQAALAEEVARAQHRHHGFPARRRQHRQLHGAVLDVKHAVGRHPLGEGHRAASEPDDASRHARRLQIASNVKRRNRRPDGRLLARHDLHHLTTAGPAQTAGVSHCTAPRAPRPVQSSPWIPPAPRPPAPCATRRSPPMSLMGLGLAPHGCARGAVRPGAPGESRRWRPTCGTSRHGRHSNRWTYAAHSSRCSRRPPVSPLACRRTRSCPLRCSGHGHRGRRRSPSRWVSIQCCPASGHRFTANPPRHGTRIPSERPEGNRHEDDGPVPVGARA